MYLSNSCLRITSLPTRRSKPRRRWNYEGVSVRVVRPEYLVALYLEPSARTAKRRERAAALIEAAATDQTDQTVLKDLIHRFKLEP